MKNESPGSDPQKIAPVDHGRAQRNLIIIIGPQAVGKMTVGQEICQRTGYALLHNHHLTELLLPFFAYPSASFQGLQSKIRDALLSETATHFERGLVMTYIWDFSAASDRVFINKIIALFEEHNWRVSFVELEASLPQRLVRNTTENRLLHKASKRDRELSDRLMRAYNDSDHNSNGRFLLKNPHVVVNNEALEPVDVAVKALKALGIAATAKNSTGSAG